MLGRMLLRRGVPAVVRPVTRTIVLPIRSYATPGRPKSVVGEPSRPVKRAVKKAAAKPADGSSPAAKNVAAKRDAAAKKSKKTSPTKRQPKQLTEAQTAALKERQAKAKARKQVVVEKEKLNELKRIALSPPKLVGDNPYAVFTKEKNKERGSLSTASESSTRETRLKNFTKRVTAVAAEWKSLNAAEREKYQHLYAQDLARYQAEYEVTYQHAPPAARLPLASAA
ncbi:uncharacterized protein MYCGRDRAFT_89562 [Zymoseptoria tritici IPO323]|uniref:HMG box domain-containing protein n=1 Tax=Zymoseptoria tritici (strain CBS 115943 / IPO323) TaxID=336722 RepID=F9WY47_ZYMTI|nr:uncharacterized protein MYCGRDRAFT_89562 [Zymoseptoria tritici IPO323]EGP91364.1 hypothetical protein MYCGRDRAFT_89562 [Zymoseptoria tritici IPO323]